MRYRIKEKVFSLGDKFTIKSQFGQDVYQVAGQFLSIGQKLRLMDMSGREAVYIEEKVFRFMPEYSIYMGGNRVANVKKKIRLFSHEFVIDSTMGNYSIEGDIFAHDFSIYKDGRAVAWANKEWISLGDAYEVEISDSENQAFMLAMIIVIDQAIHDNKRRR
jgi:uncharacterized protein YxjI